MVCPARSQVRSGFVATVKNMTAEATRRGIGWLAVAVSVLIALVMIRGSIGGAAGVIIPPPGGGGSCPNPGGFHYDTSVTVTATSATISYNLDWSSAWPYAYTNISWGQAPYAGPNIAVTNQLTGTTVPNTVTINNLKPWTHYLFNLIGWYPCEDSTGYHNQFGDGTGSWYTNHMSSWQTSIINGGLAVDSPVVKNMLLCGWAISANLTTQGVTAKDSGGNWYFSTPPMTETTVTLGQPSGTPPYCLFSETSENIPAVGAPTNLYGQNGQPDGEQFLWTPAFTLVVPYTPTPIPVTLYLTFCVDFYMSPTNGVVVVLEQGQVGVGIGLYGPGNTIEVLDIVVTVAAAVAAA